MSQKEFYYVPVNKYNKYTPGEYRKVSCDELDTLIKLYAANIEEIISDDRDGATILWAAAIEYLNSNGFENLCNMYALMANHNRPLNFQINDLSAVFRQYKTLRRIRSCGSLKEYYEAKAELTPSIEEIEHRIEIVGDKK